MKLCFPTLVISGTSTEPEVRWWYSCTAGEVVWQESTVVIYLIKMDTHADFMLECIWPILVGIITTCRNLLKYFRAIDKATQFNSKHFSIHKTRSWCLTCYHCTLVSHSGWGVSFHVMVCWWAQFSMISICLCASIPGFLLTTGNPLVQWCVGGPQNDFHLPLCKQSWTSIEECHSIASTDIIDVAN